MPDVVRVALCDDHGVVRSGLRRILDAEDDLEVVGEAGTVKEAVAVAASCLPDVFVMDLGLPDGSGWDLVSYAREQRPLLRIGVVTGWEPRNEKDPACDFTLRKPVGAVDLLAQIAGET